MALAPDICIECESSNVDSLEMGMDIDDAWEEFECLDCGCVWEVLYDVYPVDERIIRHGDTE